MRHLATSLLWAWGAVSGCSSREPMPAEIEVVSVDPRVVPPEVDAVSVLFRTTRSGALRVEANDLPEGSQIVGHLDAVDAGGLGAVQVSCAGFPAGPHLVTLILAPAGAKPPVEAEASFYVGAAPEDDPEPDGGVTPDEDGGGGEPTCEQGCAGAPAEAVCGSDARTYENPCLLECAGVQQLFEGSCEDPQTACLDVCLSEGVDFVCSDEGVTYLNPCHLECDGARLDHGGPCFGL